MDKETDKPKKSKLAAAPPVEDTTMPGAFDLFKPSMEIIRRNLVAFLILLGIPTVLLLIGNGPDLLSPSLESRAENQNNGAIAFMGLIGAIAALLTTPAVILLELRGAHKEQLELGEAFSKGLHYFWKLIGLSICLAVIYAVSILLLIVPFFFALRRYFLAPYYLVDRDLSIFEALKVSAQESQGKWGPIYGVIGVIILIGLINIIPVLGWIVSTVVAFLYSSATALRYLHIKAIEEDKDPITPIEAELRQAA